MNRPPSLAAGAGLLAAPGLAPGQAKYPDHPIRLVIPFPPAGPTDIIGRKAAEKLTAMLGQNVGVDNKTGAPGPIGAVDVKNAQPAGHKFLLATSSPPPINPPPFIKPPHDPAQ